MPDRLSDFFHQMRLLRLTDAERQGGFDALMDHAARHPVGSVAEPGIQPESLAEIPALSGVNDVSLYGYEKSLIFKNIAGFMEDHPVARATKATTTAPRQHASPSVHLAVWEGTNIFRYVQPFYITSPAVSAT